MGADPFQTNHWRYNNLNTKVEVTFKRQQDLLQAIELFYNQPILEGLETTIMINLYKHQMGLQEKRMKTEIQVNESTQPQQTLTTAETQNTQTTSMDVDQDQGEHANGNRQKNQNQVTSNTTQ